MSTELLLFLACSFSKDRTGADGCQNDQGISDFELAEIVKETLEAESDGQICVKITKDPFDNYIPSKVREELASADLMLCLFTRRTPTPNSHLWMTSSFVVSEGSAFLMQLPTEAETHSRLFGLMEEGVDHTQLGMAFPLSKTLPRFDRMNVSGLKEKVREIVHQIVRKEISPRDDREYLSLDKTVTILRDGGVQVETRHRFRFTVSTRKSLIPHTIWRVSQPLPAFPQLLEPCSNSRDGILRCLPLDCSHPGQPSCKLRIIPESSNGSSNEYRFHVEVTGIQFRPGDELEYAIAWEYPLAFSANATPPNSVGLRCGERGIVQHTSLTLRFERDLDEPDRILEDDPEITESSVTGFSLNQEPVGFWHSPTSWRNSKRLSPCRKRSGLRYEVYRWTKDQFLGMAKVTFVPHMNYFRAHVASPNQGVGLSVSPADTKSDIS